MAWVPFISQDTDSGSPLNQYLIDGIRTNLELLPKIRFKHISMETTQFPAGDIPGWDSEALDATYDYSDHLVWVRGNVRQYASASQYYIGGSGDKNIGSDYSGGNELTKFINNWAYVTPSPYSGRITGALTGTGNASYIWFNNGKLTLRWYCNAADADFANINLIIIAYGPMATYNNFK